jgi:ribosomal protein L11 methyltransferase
MAMWFELHLAVASPLAPSAWEELVTKLMAQGASGCEEVSPLLLKAYGEWEAEAQATIVEWVSVLNPSITCLFQPIQETNWVAACPELNQELTSGCFRIIPRSSLGESRKDDWNDGLLPLHINLGHGFGTGHHATTRSLLALLSEFAAKQTENSRPISTIADIGTGSGILAIAAARLFPSSQILALDNDPVAIQNAKENILLNTIPTDQIKLATCDIRETGGSFDLILANIYAEILIDQSATLETVSKPGSIAMLSGIKYEKSSGVLDAYLPHWVERHKIVTDEWCSLVLEKK